jgi:hypothetical protein
MRKYQILEVDLTDYTTFKPFPGAEDFKNEFKEFSTGPRKFTFFNEEEKEKAEKRLNELNLTYNTFYRLQFESEQELNQYHSVIISFPYETILSNDSSGTITVDAKKMSKFDIVIDNNSDYFVLTSKGKTFFEREIPSCIFKPLLDKSGKKQYYLYTNIHVLSHPRIYQKVREVTKSHAKETAEDFIVVGSDDRINFSDEGIQEIKNHVLCSSNTFQYENLKYNAALKIKLCIGEFANKFTKEFGGEDKRVFITPIQLDEGQVNI